MGFNEKQIFPAILNEYEHGEEYCQLAEKYSYGIRREKRKFKRH